MHTANAFVFEQFSAPYLIELSMSYFYFFKEKKKKSWMLYVNDNPEGNFYTETVKLYCKHLARVQPSLNHSFPSSIIRLV